MEEEETVRRIFNSEHNHNKNATDLFAVFKKRSRIVERKG